MISVVMATYNGERYLREQLESICNQTHKPDEIIIGDDHSSDSTPVIIQAFMKETKVQIHFFYNPERLGYAKNFRRVLSLAKGDLIFLSDQDDIWEKEKIEMCVKFFNQYSDVLALSTAYRLINENGRLKKEDRFYHFFSCRKSKKVKWKSFIKHPKYPGMAMVIRKTLLDNINLWGNWENLPHDWQLNQEAAYYNGMYFLNIALTRYRLHADNTVGMAFHLSTDRKDKREKMIKDMELSLQAVALEHTEQHKYLDRAIQFQKTRRSLYVRKRILLLFLYDLLHLDYISFRSTMGDFYTGVKFFILGEYRE